MITSTRKGSRNESTPASDDQMSKKNSSKKATKSKAAASGKAKTAAGKSAPNKGSTGDAFSAGDALIQNNPQLKNTLQQIEKEFGEGSIMPLGSAQQGRIKGISTGCLSLDLALGGQGIPRGRVIEMFGPESSGKTTLALQVPNRERGIQSKHL